MPYNISAVLLKICTFVSMNMHLHHLLPNIKGIPVLMYHHVLPGHNNEMSISPERLREQWAYLADEGYISLSLHDFLDIAAGKEATYPERSFLLTFDDGYRDNLTYAYPLLQEFNWKATFFIIAGTLDGAVPPAVEKTDTKMNIAELASLAPEIVQLAIHGYEHEHFGNTDPADLKCSIEKSITAFENSRLPFNKVIAYPYGARPSGSTAKENIKQWMKDAGISAAFRIGNKVNKIPLPDMYEIKRIDIRGTDSIEDFKIKLKKGKLKPF